MGETMNQPSPIEIPDSSLHAQALVRHAVWALEFAEAGEIHASLDERRDMRAIVEELRIDSVEEIQTPRVD
jgi:hypothetical protein